MVGETQEKIISCKVESGLLLKASGDGASTNSGGNVCQLSTTLKEKEILMQTGAASRLFQLVLNLYPRVVLVSSIFKNSLPVINEPKL